MIKIIVLSRLTTEKGIDKVMEFAKRIPFDYIIDIYGVGGCIYPTAGTNVTFKGYAENGKDLIKNYDYLMQLSLTEGFAYSVQEALQQRVPVLVTPYPSAFENVVDGENGYFIPFDVKNFSNFEKLLNIPKPKKFKELGSEQQWIDLFNKTYKKAITMRIKVIQPVSNFKLGEIVDLSEERCANAVALGLAEYYVDEVVKEKKERKKL